MRGKSGPGTQEGARREGTLALFFFFFNSWYDHC